MAINKRFASEEYVDNANTLLSEDINDLTERVTATENNLSDLPDSYSKSETYSKTETDNKISSALTTETWTFTLDNGSTITKQVVVK